MDRERTLGETEARTGSVRRGAAGVNRATRCVRIGLLRSGVGRLDQRLADDRSVGPPAASASASTTSSGRPEAERRIDPWTSSPEPRPEGVDLDDERRRAASAGLRASPRPSRRSRGDESADMARATSTANGHGATGCAAVHRVAGGDDPTSEGGSSSCHTSYRSTSAAEREPLLRRLRVPATRHALGRHQVEQPAPSPVTPSGNGAANATRGGV